MGVGDSDSAILFVEGRGATKQKQKQKTEAEDRRQKSKFRNFRAGGKAAGACEESAGFCGEGSWTAKESRGMMIRRSESCMGREALAMGLTPVVRTRMCLMMPSELILLRIETLQYMLACVMYAQDEPAWKELSSGCDESV